MHWYRKNRIKVRKPREQSSDRSLAFSNPIIEAVREEKNLMVMPEMVKAPRDGFTVVCTFNARVAVHAGLLLVALKS